MTKVYIVRKLDDTNLPRISDAIDLLKFCGATIITEVDDITPDTTIIAIGGDGTMIHAAKLAIDTGSKAVAGINCGTLGFLTDFNLCDIKQLVQHIKTNDCDTVDVEQRRTLSIGDAVAVNEVFASALGGGVLRATVTINGNVAFPFIGDGIICSTPTGSTAYSLSAGGAIVSPTLPIIQITPVASHTLTLRPIIVSADDTIKIESDRDMIVSVDGQSGNIHDRRAIVIKSDIYKSVNVVRNREQHNTVFDVLRDKMSFSIRNN